MATIIENGMLFTISPEAEQVLLKRNTLLKCDALHTDLSESDYPVYHIFGGRIGTQNIYSIIRSAEQEAEKDNE